MQPLAGQVAMITGSGKRVGAAIARHLHAAGARILIHHRHSGAEAASLASLLNESRAHSARILAGDLLATNLLPDLMQRAVSAFGRLDILVNNASSFYPTPLGSVTEKQWDDLLGTNLKAPLFLAQAAIPHLKATHGLIVNLVDIHSQRPLPDHTVYCTAKAGLAMLTRCLARELGPDIRVNGVAPGPILWPEGGLDASLQDKIIGRTALRRAGSPDDIGKAVLFFAKDAPYVTGQILAVDGGRSIGW